MSTDATRSVAREIARRRLEAQRLGSTTFASPAEAVAWFGAVQAQDYLGALWAVGLRVKGARETDIERAVAEGEIVRSWPMRGTLHFMSAEDARWMIELLAPKAARRAAARLRALGIDADVLSRARRAMVKALEGGRCLARPEAHRALAGARIETSKERGLTILWQLAHEGLLCMGPRQGKQHSFVLLEEWAPRGKRRRGDEALAEIACRYFASHGPATEHDFSWWSGMSVAEARRAMEVAGSLLRVESIAGHPFWSARSAPAGASRGGKVAHALPPFDEFFVGYADRSAALDPVQAKRMAPFELLGRVVVHDGRLVASWKRGLPGGKVVCATTPQTKLTSQQRAAIRRALSRYAAFLQLDLHLE